MQGEKPLTHADSTAKKTVLSLALTANGSEGIYRSVKQLAKQFHEQSLKAAIKKKSLWSISSGGSFGVCVC